MEDDGLLLFDEPLFCCLLPFEIRLTGPGCDTPSCGDLKNVRVACRAQRRTKIKPGLFAVTILVQVFGTFQRRRVRGARCFTLKLPCADKGTQIVCRLVPRSLRSVCASHSDGTECEASLVVQVCVVAPCPSEHHDWDDGDHCTKKGARKRVLRPRSKRAHCPECEEIRRVCPPRPPRPCDDDED